MKASAKRPNGSGASAPKLVPPTPPVPAKADLDNTQPVGSIVRIDPTDLAVVEALNEAIVKTKAAAFDQCLSIFSQTIKTVEPMDQEYRSKARAAAIAAGARLEGDSEWKLVLEDGAFTRTK